MTTTGYSIKTYPQTERPRERMEMFGPEKLADRELLAILLATGNREMSALDLADQVLLEYKGLTGLADTSLQELTRLKGIGPAKATTIAAAVELGRRIRLGGQDYRPAIHSPADAARVLQKELQGQDREHFQILMLNHKKVLIGIETVSIGTVNSSPVHPREVFKQAIRRSASSVILAHNHPSGNCEPSEQDRLVTQRLKEVGNIVGIEVIDHLIIGGNEYYSFLEHQIF